MKQEINERAKTLTLEMAHPPELDRRFRLILAAKALYGLRLIEAKHLVSFLFISEMTTLEELKSASEYEKCVLPDLVEHAKKTLGQDEYKEFCEFILGW